MTQFNFANLLNQNDEIMTINDEIAMMIECFSVWKIQGTYTFIPGGQKKIGKFGLFISNDKLMLCTQLLKLD